MKPMTHQLRNKIREYIKSGIDISDLIKDVSIKGEDLSGAKIKSFDRIKEDISDCNLSRAVIGEAGKIIHLSGSKLLNVKFRGTTFLGKVIMRRADCRGSNFCETWIPYFEYQFTDFRNCTFCDITWQMGSRGALGAKFDLDFFQELGKALNLEITCKPKEPSNLEEIVDTGETQ